MATSRKNVASASGGTVSQGKSPSRHEQITLIAYLKAEARGFSPGHELDDWLEAEREVRANSSKTKH